MFMPNRKHRKVVGSLAVKRVRNERQLGAAERPLPTANTAPIRAVLALAVCGLQVGSLPWLPRRDYHQPQTPQTLNFPGG